MSKQKICKCGGQGKIIKNSDGEFVLKCKQCGYTTEASGTPSEPKREWNDRNKPPLTNYEKICQDKIFCANIISLAMHGDGYEDDDYDPEIMSWLDKEAE